MHTVVIGSPKKFQKRFFSPTRRVLYLMFAMDIIGKFTFQKIEFEDIGYFSQ